MQVQVGQIVSMRDGRTIYVTDVASQESDDYRVFSIDAYEKDGSFVIKDELPIETILVGLLLTDEFRRFYDYYNKLMIDGTGSPYVEYIANSIVSDLSEVVSILT